MNIIAVDNEPLVLTALTDCIHEAEPGADVQGFKDAHSALEYAKKTPTHTAFLDIEMGNGTSGLELAKQLRELESKTNIIFVTGYSQYALEAFSLYASGYILKPPTPSSIHEAMDHLRYPHPEDKRSGLRVQTFGNFEVYINGAPLKFPRSKSKELLAYLIHKRGTGCTVRELATILFEEKEYDHSIRRQIQTIISCMIKTLSQSGYADIVKKQYNHMSINVDKVYCDYYQFLMHDPAAINSYTGEYMSNYSWGEFVVGYLDRHMDS